MFLHMFPVGLAQQLDQSSFVLPGLDWAQFSGGQD